MKHIWLIGLSLLWSHSLWAQPTLHVMVNNLAVEQGGQVMVHLYDQSGWLDADRSLISKTQTVTANSLEMAFELDESWVGKSVAVSVLHDANRNGQRDMRWLPYPRPKEGMGFSLNPDVTGKPDFAQSQWSLLKHVNAQSIEMRYYD